MCKENMKEPKITTRKEGITLSWSNLVKVINDINEAKSESNFILKSILIGGKNSHDRNSQRVILNEVTGEALPGEVLGIMGPSGAGKTTLLNVLAGRATYDAGAFKLSNGQDIQAFKRNMAYITQKDVFFRHLTVYDQLLYTAYLRLPGSKEEKFQEVNRMIDLLRLQKCQNTPIKLLSGGETKRVNIGTELLTNPSVVLLDEPTSGLDSTSAVALLRTLREDLALKCNKTIITSIHQPSSFAFLHALDKVLLLADGGYVVYHGTPKDSLSYLKHINMCCPEGYNAADHWMDLLVGTESIKMNSSMHKSLTDDSGERILELSQTNELHLIDENADEPKFENNNDDGEATKEVNCDIEAGLKKRRSSSIIFSVNREKEKLRRRDNAVLLAKVQRKKYLVAQGSQSNKANLISSWKEMEEKRINPLVSRDSIGSDLSSASSKKVSSGGTSSIEAGPKYTISWFAQYKVLTHRAFRNSSEAIFTPLNVVKSILLGLVAGLMWFQMEHTERYIDDRSSLFFFTMTFWVFDAMFGAIFAFPNERSIIFKERASGSYHLSAYFLAKTTSEAPTLLALPTIFMIISYWMANVNSSFLIFLGSTGCALLSVCAGESLGLLCGALIMDFERAMTSMVVVSLFLMVSGGFFVKNMPSFITWAKYLSPFKYAFDASRQLVFNSNVPCDGSKIICLAADKTYATVDEVKDHLKINGSLAFNAGMLFLIFVIPRYLALLALGRKKISERS